MLKKILAIVLLAVFLPGCTTAPTGRSRLVSLPHPVKDVTVALKIRLAGQKQETPDTTVPSELSTFAFQVRTLYAQLAEAVTALYGNVPLNGVDIIDNESPACLIDPNERRILIYRGLGQLGLTEDQLALILSREMARIVGDHHGELSTGALLAGAAILVLNPVAALASFLPSTLATTAATTAGSVPMTRYALSTGVSVAGGQAVEALIDMEHEKEADLIAIELMKWSRHDLEQATETLDFEGASHSAWVNNHMEAQQRIRALLAAAAQAKVASEEAGQQEAPGPEAASREPSGQEATTQALTNPESSPELAAGKASPSVQLQAATQVDEVRADRQEAMLPNPLPEVPKEKDATSPVPAVEESAKPSLAPPVYAVQVGIFPSLKAAAVEVAKWRSRGYRFYVNEVSDVNGRAVYAVRAGSFKQRKEALALKRSLERRKNVSPILVRLEDFAKRIDVRPAKKRAR